MEALKVDTSKFDLASTLGISKIRGMEIQKNLHEAMVKMANSVHGGGSEFVSTADEVAAAAPIAHDEKELAYVMFITGIQEERMNRMQDHALNLLGKKGDEVRERMRTHRKEMLKQSQKPVDDILNDILKKGDDNVSE